MDQISGQIDIFDALDEPMPVPLFTVYTCVWAEKGCGWCGSKGMLGGGACRNPKNSDESWFYSYCGRCYELHGTPKVTAEGYPLQIDRTVKPRPGDAPEFSQGTHND